MFKSFQIPNKTDLWIYAHRADNISLVQNLIHKKRALKTIYTRDSYQRALETTKQENLSDRHRNIWIKLSKEIKKIRPIVSHQKVETVRYTEN